MKTSSVRAVVTVVAIVLTALNDGPLSAQEPAPSSGGRLLLVDRRGGTAYATIAAAVAVAGPGDTIQLAAGSGPYRELVHISRSGEPGRPITFDGNGETVTGLEPFSFHQEEGRWVCDVTPFLTRTVPVQGFEKKDGIWVNSAQPLAFPGVLVYRGRRVFQNVGGDFLPVATLTEGGKKLVLEPGIEPEGWEIASREAVFRILNVSHHVYRNTRASGSLNDGYNLHGTGTDIVFENIEGFQNLDEGFSAHDKIECVVRTGRFWENDNGLCNVEACSMTATDIETFSNAGWGFALLKCRGELTNVRSWDNGMVQIAFYGATVTCRNVVAVKPKWDKRRWITSQESKRGVAIGVFEKSSDAVLDGSVTVEN